MTLIHERYVASRFTEFESRFRPEIAVDDYRLVACIEAFGDLAGRRILDLGCGKGRFACRFRELGADVIGLDGSQGMLAHASKLDRVRASALRLPFASRSFDGVMAVEVFEHLPNSGIGHVMREISRVLKPGGRLAIVDKNVFALDAKRPWLPKIVVKKLDERRGLWMYSHHGPVRERWFRPQHFAAILGQTFADVKTQFLISPEESRKAIFHRIPRSRLMTLWTARIGEVA